MGYTYSGLNNNPSDSSALHLCLHSVTSPALSSPRIHLQPPRSSSPLLLCCTVLHKTLMLYLYVTETLLIVLIDGSIWSSKPTGTKRQEYFTSGSLTADRLFLLMNASRQRPTSQLETASVVKI